MKKIYQGLLAFIKNHKIWSIVILLIVVALVWSLSGSKKTATTNFALAEIGTVKEEVSVTGNVKPLTDVDLAFERGGKVANINVEVGDKVYTGQILASISNADLIASLNQAQANLKKVKAGLGDGVISKELAQAQAKISLANSIKDSYTKADDALRNKIFSLFNNPVRYGAKLSFTTDTFLQDDIEEGKDKATDSLDAWQRVLSKTDINLDLESNYTLAKTNLNVLQR
jgi:multidrug efflux pump subunit AcrA (membrane-fusion protein)